MEIKYRKEQGLEDFVPSGAKISSVGETTMAAVAADPSNVSAQIAAAAASSVDSTPESRAALVEQLNDLSSEDSKAMIATMETLKTDGLAPRFVCLFLVGCLFVFVLFVCLFGFGIL